MDNLYKKTEGVLYNYNNIKAEIKNLALDIEDMENDYEGTSAVVMEEKTGCTNKFNSAVENEVISREATLKRLKREKRSKERMIEKIDNALCALGDNEREIIELKYLKKYSWNRIESVMNLDRSYCGRIKKKATEKVSSAIWNKEKVSQNKSFQK